MSAVLLTGNYLSSQAVSNQVLSAYVGLTTVFGMGTGGSPQLSPPDGFDFRFVTFDLRFSWIYESQMSKVDNRVRRVVPSKLHRRRFKRN